MTAGILRAGATNVFAPNALVTVGTGATIDLTFSQTVGSLAGGGNVILGGGSLTTGGDNTSSAFSGAISGGGSLVKAGSGSLVLTGANTYTGGTLVSGGALVGNTTGLQGNITNNALVLFDQNPNGTYGGSMSGSGILTKIGSGALTLTGTNTYTGGTLINAGSVVGSTASLQGLIVNNASLTLGGAADGLFNGVLAGTGSVTKTGIGTTTLSGTHPLTGLLNLSQGTLVLNGLFGGGINVAPGATLRAAGTIAGSVNLAGSLFAFPGAAAPPAIRRQSLAATSGDALTTPPILTIGGDFTAVPGSVLRFPIGSGPNPSILVAGRGLLRGTMLDLTAEDPGNRRATTFIALRALQGLTMTDTNAVTQRPALVPVLTQDPNSLFVTLLNMQIPLEGVASDRNGSVARAVDRIKLGATGDGALVVRELTALDDSALDDAFDQIAGQIHSSSLYLAAIESQSFTDMVRSEATDSDHEAKAGYTSGGSSIRWWTQLGGEHATLRGTDDAKAAVVDLGVGAGGFDWRRSDRWSFGAGGGVGAGSMGMSALNASSDFKAPRAFGRVGFRPRGFGLRGGGSAARTTYKTRRNMAFAARLPAELGAERLSGGISRLAESEQTGLVGDAWSEYDDSVDVKTYTLDWMVGLRRVTITRDSFQESGALSLDLSADDSTLNLTQTDVKVHLWRRKGKVRPFVEGTFRRELTDGTTTTAVQFTDAENSDFSVDGQTAPGNTVTGRGGVTLRTWLGSWTFEYRFQLAPGQTRQSADIRVRFK